MDCTYKTNFYKLTLFHIVGVSSTNLTFSIGFAYQSVEKRENYEWTLRQLKEAIIEKVNLVQVIITYRELAIMDAIQLVFPQTPHLLCRWHIEKAIKTRIRKGISKVECDEIIWMWKKVVYSETDEQLAMALALCKEALCVETFKYLEETWVTPYKEQFVSIWTDKVFHLGNTHTSHVEGAHATLMNWLGTINCDMATGWDAIASLCDQQFSNIEALFEISKVKWSVTTFGEKWCRYLRGMVSLDGLMLVKQEMDRAKEVGMSQENCGCVIRQTHGLPCAHEIATTLRERDFLPRSVVHVHWKSLSMDDEVVMDDETLDPHPHIEAFLKLFESSSKTQEVELIQRLKEVTKPECITLSQPSKKLNPRGRPRKLKTRKIDEYSTKRESSLFEHVEIFTSYEESQTKKKEVKEKKAKVSRPKKSKVNQVACTLQSSSTMSTNFLSIHLAFRSYVDEINDVQADENCGYQAVAMALGMKEDEWPIIRKHVSEELRSDIAHYDKVFREIGHIERLLKEIEWFSGPCQIKHWMNTPNVLWPIAEVYNIVISLFSQTSGGTVTCFPIKAPPKLDEPAHISITVRDCHYWCVKLKSSCPLPPLLARWKELSRFENREAWLTKFGSRLEEGAHLIKREHSTSIDITSLE